MALLTIRYDRQMFLEFQAKRSLNNKEGAIKSFKWFDKYLSSLGETEDSVIPKLEELKGSDKFYLFLNGFVQFMHQELSPNATATYLSFLKSYLRKQGFKIYKEDAKQFIDMPKSFKESRVPLTKEIIRKLLDNASPHMRTVILWLSSSGMRPMEFVKLEPDDVQLDKDPVEVSLRAEITKGKRDRTTFISQQAKDSMTPYLFKKGKTKLQYINLKLQFDHLLKKCGLDSKYRTSNIHHITLHTFRSFFRTKAGRLDKDFAEDLMGHEGYLKQYVRLTMDEKRDYYKQLELSLRI